MHTIQRSLSVSSNRGSVFCSRTLRHRVETSSAIWATVTGGNEKMGGYNRGFIQQCGLFILWLSGTSTISCCRHDLIIIKWQCHYKWGSEGFSVQFKIRIRHRCHSSVIQLSTFFQWSSADVLLSLPPTPTMSVYFSSWSSIYPQAPDSLLIGFCPVRLCSFLRDFLIQTSPDSHASSASW